MSLKCWKLYCSSSSAPRNPFLSRTNSSAHIISCVVIVLMVCSLFYLYIYTHIHLVHDFFFIYITRIQVVFFFIIFSLFVLTHSFFTTGITWRDDNNSSSSCRRYNAFVIYFLFYFYFILFIYLSFFHHPISRLSYVVVVLSLIVGNLRRMPFLLFNRFSNCCCYCYPLPSWRRFFVGSSMRTLTKKKKTHVIIILKLRYTVFHYYGIAII